MKSLIMAITLLAATAPALANHDGQDASINEREYRLAQRIEQGWRSGELTRQEYARLRFELRDIERNEHYFMADGRLSPRERGQLQVRLDNLSRDIYRQKHDVERRGGYYNGDYHAYRRY
jgi:DNA-binding CsgD family transcriptional regulator